MDRDALHRRRGYRTLAWSVLVFNGLVVLGGAVVRATGSGAGCGASWPRCGSQIIPTSPALETVIEFTHRVMSGAAIVGVVLVVVLAFVLYSRADRVRVAAAWSGFFLAVEALLGASLVLFGWVDQDASLGRIVVVPLHLMNTYLLLAALTLTAWWAAGPRRPYRLETRKLRRPAVMAALLLLVGVFGAWNALADTLFPADTIAGGIADEMAATAPFLLRVRVLHPIVAIAAGLVVARMVFATANRAQGTERRLGFAVVGLVFAQVFVGLTNVFLLTPIETQVLQLAVANVMWVVFVLFAATAVDEVAVSNVAAGRWR